MKKLHVDQIESLPVTHLGLNWKPVRHALDVNAFGINAYHAPNPGDLVVEEHADPHQELYVIVRGRARFRADEEEFDAPAGTLVLFEPREHRVAHAVEADTVVLAVGAEAKRFETSGWEYAFRGKALFDLGRYDEARRAVEQGLAHYSDRADLLYGRACLEAQAGELEAAIATLRKAAESYPGVVKWARAEPVFEPYRDRLDSVTNR